MSILNNIITALPAKKSGHFEAKIALHQYIIAEFERWLDAIPKAVSEIYTPEEDFIINADAGESDWVSDNATTFAYVKKMGVSSSCERLAKEISTCCSERNTWLSVIHILEKNDKADYMSRLLSENTAWKLDP